jgi:hypothetical protein
MRSLPFAIWMMLQTVPSLADGLPPLRADTDNLRSLVFSQLHDRWPPPHPTLRTDAPFGTISPYITGLESFIQFGLIETPEDSAALSEYLQLSLGARLQELGIADEIQVRPLAQFEKGLDDCDVLGVAVHFRARETVHDGRPVVAVVVNTLLWQLVPEPGLSNAFSTCSAYKGPSLTDLDEVYVFLVDLNERDEALARAKEALLSIVDGAILRRLIGTNATAIRRVKSWIE